MVGAPLFKVAVAAQRLLWDKLALPMTIIAGPFLPEADWQELQQQADACPELILIRHVPNMAELLASHFVSVSQCGYNTVMDLLKSGISALVVPFAHGQEVEQSNRADRLSKLGLLRQVAANDLDVDRFVAEVEQLLMFTPNAAALDLDGAVKSAQIIHDLVARKTELTQPVMPKQVGICYG